MLKFFVNIWLMSVLTLALSALAGADESIEPFLQDVSAKEAANLIEENSDIIILDVRTPLEFRVSHIENAININYYSFSFKEQLEKLDPTKTYLLHCQRGVRSGKTIPIMQESGFTKIYHLNKGFKAWTNADLPTT